MSAMDPERLTRDEAIEYFRQLDLVFRSDYTSSAGENAEQRAVTDAAFAALGVTSAELAQCRTVR